MPKPWRNESKLRKLYYEELLDQSQIADRLGCSRTTVKKWFNKLGIETRNQSEVVELSHKKNSSEKEYKNKNTLKKLYYNERLSCAEIADELGCDESRIEYWMDKHELERRSLSESKKTLTPTFYTNKDGYEIICNSNKIKENCDEIRLHRLIALVDNNMEYVSENVVHHKNGIKWDNRPENLEVLPNNDHVMMHQEEIHDIEDTSYRDEDVLEKLYVYEDLSMREIGEKFGVGAMTIRKWLIETGVHPNS